MVSPQSPHCPRCGARSQVLTVPRDRHGHSDAEVRACGSAVCGVAFTWPAPSDQVQAAPAAGDLRGVGAKAAQSLAAASVASLARRLAPRSLVVDVGAGTGLRARALIRRGHRVIALEPDPLEEMRAHVELTGTDAEVHLAGVAQLADVLDGRQADAIVMWHVLEHVPQPDDALRAVRGGLRHAGLLSVAVPNRRSLEAQVFGDRWHAWEPSRHRWHFDERSLRLMLGEAGFSVSDISPRGGWGYPSSLAFSLAPGLDPQINPRRALAGRGLALAMVPVAAGARALGRGAQLVTLARRA